MKKSILCLIFSLLITTLFSQETYFIDKDDNKLIMHENTNEDSYFKGDYGFGGYYLHYHNKDGKLIKKAQSKIKEMVDGKKRWVNMKIGSMFGFRRLHEIILESDKYLLTQYFESGFHYAYIQDKETGKFVEKKMKISWSNKRDKKTFKKKILPYFKDCTLFVALVEANIKDSYRNKVVLDFNGMFMDISNMKCL